MEADKAMEVSSSGNFDSNSTLEMKPMQIHAKVRKQNICFGISFNFQKNLLILCRNCMSRSGSVKLHSE
jgi:hypothetical protein